jgi:hypothetical protein
MKTFKLILQCVALVIMFFVIILTLVLPFIVSYVTGNWWFMFLYFVIGIPFLMEFTILMILLDLD